jgi:hypothetical protein
MSYESKDQPWWRRPLPPSRFFWKEPKAYRRHKNQHDLPAFRQAQRWVFVGYSLFFVFLWLIGKISSKGNASSSGLFLVLAVGASALIAYGLLPLSRLSSVEIAISERSISRGRMRWPFKFFESYTWIPMNDWLIMLLKMKSGRVVTVAAPRDVPREVLDALFQRHGLRREPDGHWTDHDELAFLRGAVQ